MVNISSDELTTRAMQATSQIRDIAERREGWQFMGYVGAALTTEGGVVHTGVNLTSLYCGIGFCAEHSAVAEMLKSGESRIASIVAVTVQAEVLPPCGRCRELLFQVDPGNLDTEVVLPDKRTIKLRELLPHNWQNHIAALG